MIDHGELVLLVSPKNKRYLRRLDPAQPLHTGDGVLDMTHVAAAGFGGQVDTHLGKTFRVIKPTVYDLAKNVKRQTQIMYPKEIGYAVMKLGIGPGATVVEAGTGSGSFTICLAWFVGPTGKVYTFERRAEFKKLAARNLRWAGLDDGRVEQAERDIADGFGVTGADALFLDVRTPWDYLEHAAAAVRPGAPVGFLLPTVNQVSELLAALESGPFQDAEVVEILLRRYKPVPDRLRPEDRMVAHTGFLVFARHAGVEAEIRLEDDAGPVSDQEPVQEGAVAQEPAPDAPARQAEEDANG